MLYGLSSAAKPNGCSSFCQRNEVNPQRSIFMTLETVPSRKTTCAQAERVVSFGSVTYGRSAEGLSGLCGWK